MAPSPITRRDFLNGIPLAAGVTAASSLLSGHLATAAAAPAPQDVAGYDPPALTGMRGSHPGSFEAAHRLRESDFWSAAGKVTQTNEDYDLVIVGGGIIGLSG